MNRSFLLSLCLLAPACKDSRPAPTPPPPSVLDAGKDEPVPPDAGLADAGLVDAGSTVLDAGSSTPDAGGNCSARGMSATPTAPRPALPPATESMRRRIIAAAVACDYAALGVLANEGGEGLRFSFGPEEDPVAFWREEESFGQPVLRQLVGVLNQPSLHQDGLYLWPPAFREKPTAADFAALKGLYPPEMLKAMQRDGSYLGLRVGISADGDWQLAVSGD